MELDEDASVIYGLEFNTRALTSQCGETDLIRFLVGTQSLRHDNQVHLIDFDDETCLINKHVVFHHPVGEIWNIGSSPSDKDIISTCYNQVVDNKAEMKASLWRLPLVDETQPPSQSAAPGHPRSLFKLCDLDSGGESMKSVLWNPSGDGSQLITLSDQHLKIWQLDADAQAVEEIDTTVLEGKGQPRFTMGAWNPHHGGSQVATANESTVRGWDLRSMRQVYTLDNAHGQCVRDVNFNPNKQYYLVTCGDDCKVKFWDTRNPNESLMILSDHSHWVWRVRYNHFHDQLVLSSSSDSRVILNKIVSLSSEPFPHLDDDDDDQENKDMNESSPPADGVIATYEEHEDSVYAVEWSSADPWVFASLSYDGRLVINRVPRTEKYKILL
ncbi:EARP-interacting protein homolog [Dendronephthya gigantea]|uniref:EARP-interacting protein homolog n=1 Tax=Dendronephthya gigantea TaxID=151771 RepID=UPI00106BF727|nr:EARP-interacting protein homolog [Dendronephthya gigantea]